MFGKLFYEIISEGNDKPGHWLSWHMVDPPDPVHMFDDVSDSMIAIYLEQARQEMVEDEEFKEWERVWQERYWEEYHNACSDR
jgi:hypothetical protein